MRNFNTTDKMEVEYVLKRDKSLEEMSFDKILNRIKTLSTSGKTLNINPTFVARKICSQIYNNISTNLIDELAAQICASLSTEHPDYIDLASRIEISNIHKNTSPSFSETITILYENPSNPLITKELFDFVDKNKTKLNSYKI